MQGRRYFDCVFCNGTGLDEADWSGRCFYCGGTGMTDDDEEDAFDGTEDDEECDDAS